MTEHDRLCQASINGNDDIYFCICEFIAKVRADERKQYQGRRDDMMRALSEELLNVRTDLRAKVQAMADETERDYRIDPGGYLQGLMRGFERVLVLFDGGSDGSR